MTASYPSSVKSFTTKVDGVDDVMAAHVNDIQDEVVAIETELGTTPKGGYADVAARLDEAAYHTENLSVFAATTSAQLAGVISDETGSGALVFAQSPTLVTPVLGVATATSINKVTITQPASGATLTIADGKTLTASNSITIAGTDGKTLTVNASLTLAGTDGKTLTVNDSCTLTGTGTLTLTTSLTNQGAAGVINWGGAYTMTIPATGTVAMLGVANAFTGANTFNRTITDISGEYAPIISQIYAEPSGASSALYRGLIFNAIQNSTNPLTATAYYTGGLAGIFGSAYLTNSGLVSLAIGVQARVQAWGANNTNATDAHVFDAHVINWGGGGTMTVANSYNYYSRNPVGAALTISGVAYGFYSEDITKGSTANYSWYSNAGSAVFNAGGDAGTDFTVKADNYDAIFVDASNDSIAIMNHASGKIGFFATTPIVRTAAYTVTNRVDDRSYNCDATNAAELADVLGTVIYDLQQYGLFQ